MEIDLEQVKCEKVEEERRVTPLQAPAMADRGRVSTVQYVVHHLVGMNVVSKDLKHTRGRRSEGTEIH